MNKKEYSTFEAMEELNKDVTKVFESDGAEIKICDQKIHFIHNGLFTALGDCGIKCGWFNKQWTLKPTFVDWETALKHMDCTKRSKYNKQTYSFCRNSVGLVALCVVALCNGAWKYVCDAVITLEMIHGKWELIE